MDKRSAAFSVPLSVPLCLFFLCVQAKRCPYDPRVAHRPIGFGNAAGNPSLAGGPGEPEVRPEDRGVTPVELDLKKDEALTVRWSDGRTDAFPVGVLRRWSPSAEASELRKAQAHNPLAVLPGAAAAGPVTATSAELVGRYAVRIGFSDGHATGLFSWDYLRALARHVKDQAPPAG